MNVKNMIICFSLLLFIAALVFGVYLFVQVRHDQTIELKQDNSIIKEDTTRLDNSKPTEQSNEVVKESGEEISMEEFIIEVNGQELIVKVEDNSSSQALLEKLKEGNITIDANDYNKFEKVGELGFNLPTNNKSITTKPGDVILYQGSSICLYYNTNTWNFTKLGEVINVDANELIHILGDGDVTMILKLK